MPAKPVSSACIARGDAAQRQNRQQRIARHQSGARGCQRVCFGMTLVAKTGESNTASA